jgi:hypothetical protein
LLLLPVAGDFADPNGPDRRPVIWHLENRGGKVRRVSLNPPSQ